MALAGYPATIKNGSTVINDIMTQEYPFKMDTVETSAFSGSGGAAVGTKTFIPTLLGLTVKASGSWNKGDTGQASLETAFFGRSLVSLVFSPDGTHTYSCSCWVTDYNIKADPKGKVDVDFSLLMNGNVTIV